jgi:hypothetical protein
MASKGKQSKAPTIYAYVLYGGIIKAGHTYVDTSSQHPEAEQDGESLFDSYKKYFGNDLKGRYVKCQKSLDEISEGINEALVDSKYEDSDYIYKKNVSDVVATLKEVTGAKQASTMGVYETAEAEEPKVEAKTPAAKKVVAKKAVTEEQEEGEEVKVVKTAKAKVATKAKPKQEEVEEEQEEEEAKVVAKPATKKAASKPATKPASKKAVQVEEGEEETGEVEIQPKTVQKKITVKPKTPAKTPTKGKVTTELDEDLEEEIQVQTKAKTTAKTGSKTQIVIPDDDEEEVEN